MKCKHKNYYKSVTNCIKILTLAKICVVTLDDLIIFSASLHWSIYLNDAQCYRELEKEV